MGLSAGAESLSVIWEVEPGREMLPRSSLPDVLPGGFDPPQRLAAFLDAVRWSAVTSAEAQILQAPFRSGVTIEDYQLEPVSRALDAPRVNLLLADDVGLGKHLIADRLDITGARWGLHGVEAVLRLPAVVSHGDVDLYWRHHAAREHERLYPALDQRNDALAT